MRTQAEFMDAGYKPYVNRVKKSEWYLGSVQKRVQNERGTAYFIDVDFWDFDGRKSASAHVQFYTPDERRDYINIERQVTGAIADLEEFFSAVWLRMGFGYYEEFSP